MTLFSGFETDWPGQIDENSIDLGLNMALRLTDYNVAQLYEQCVATKRQGVRVDCAAHNQPDTCAIL